MTTIAIKGTDSISDILTNFGKVKVSKTKTFLIAVTLESTVKTVCIPVIPNKDEQAKAFNSLTETEQAEFIRLTGLVDHRAKKFAASRIDGGTQERWTTRGEVEYRGVDA